MTTTQVLVVGGGPTGLTVANLLGALGVDVLLVERNPDTSNEAKAISMDDESLRSLQSAGLDGVVGQIILPGTGTKYYGRRGQLLVHARGNQPYRLGHPFKSPFAQPDLERVLRKGLERFPHVRQQFGTALEAVTLRQGRVEAQLRARKGCSPLLVAAEYVLGCDGGRSTVRELVGIPMNGRSFDDSWLVVDTVGDPHDQRYGMHHGDPGRPHVIIPGPDGRCRYEFRLRAGEATAGEPPPFELIRQLVRPYRDLAPGEVERAIVYRFHALLAERMRVDRCFLLGDAAHMMPPFAGQGLNSGIRDAANLSWKVAEVLAGRADDTLLDTYELERRPHAQAMIQLSVRLGRIVMTTKPSIALARDLLVRAVVRTPWGRRYLSEMRYRPPTHFRTGALVRLAGLGMQELVGQAISQPLVLQGPEHTPVRLDDVLGMGWSLLGVDVTDRDWETVATLALLGGTRLDVVLDDRSARARPARGGIADYDRRLDAIFGGLRGRFVLVRPDRIVASVFPPERAIDVASALRRHGLLRAPFSGAKAALAPPGSPIGAASDCDSPRPSRSDGQPPLARPLPGA